MALKLGKTNLQTVLYGLLALVALSVVYNLWVFFGRSASRAPEAPLLSTVERPAKPAGGRPAQASVDPMTIAPPPALDLTTAPAWPRDPLLAPGESRSPEVERPAVADPATPDPVISSILYSATRRSAIVDHRVVGIGDPIAGGVIVDIQPSAIVLRMPSGAERRVEMGRTFGAASGVTRSNK
jgi:hypothetical protein